MIGIRFLRHARTGRGRVKTVLCFGDSNTWGSDPATRTRFAPDVRWTGVLAAVLGEGYRVVEEGLNGRTTRWDDPIELHRNGLAYLVPCLESHQPLDLVTIMLGTNDLKARFRLSAADIAQSAAGLAQIAQRTARTADGTPSRVLLIAPPPLARLSGYDLMFEGAPAKSALFADYYARSAGWNGLDFFDAGAVIRSSDLDGIHFEAAEHRKLGEALAGRVRELIG
jgi:lysophospholipase L1-like esterase